MAFNLQKAIAAGKKKADNKALALLLLGPSGGGKSGTLNTLGVKTLHLFGSGEQHGVGSAASFGDAENVLPVQWDLDQASGEVLAPDAAYQQCLDILRDTDGIKKLGIGAVVIDGLTELEKLIYSTTAWKTAVQAQHKGITSFAGGITLAMFKPVLGALSKLRAELGIHYVCTGILNVKEMGDNGAITEATPSMHGYQVAEGIIQSFADIVIVGQVQNAKGIMSPRFQFASAIKKTTQDFDTKATRKILNVSNRLTGCDISTFPATTKNSLKLLAAAKEQGKYPTPPKTEKSA